ncbi:hypothetical protein [Sunxiuqinia indica]|uniref:hypothetical protein n=1 Tax=Sunxiuqinia indica TaxID=2692584 RepID=UPI001359E96B|nr:hypothetical protein [Sunxiuqinia indica]
MKKGTFKTFITKNTEEFASIHDGQIYTSQKPMLIFANTATMEAAEHFYSKQLLKSVKLVDVEFILKENEQ